MPREFSIRSERREELSKLTIEQLNDVQNDIIECFENFVKHNAWERSREEGRKDGHYSHDPDGLLDAITARFTLLQISRELNIFLNSYFDKIQEEVEKEDKLNQE
jgi:hypothetical protein